MSIDEHHPSTSAGGDLSASRIQQTDNDLQLLASILEHTHMLVAYLDTGLNFVRVNHAYARADNQTPEYFVGKNHFALYPHPENEIIFRRVISSGMPYFAHARAFEYAADPQRGTSYWDWSLMPTKTDDGRVTGLVFTLADVTELVSSRQDVMLFKSIVRSSSEAIVIADQRGHAVFVNQAYEELFGHAADAVRGRDCLREFIDPASLPSDINDLLLCGASAIWEGEAAAVDRNGRRFPVWMRLDCASHEEASNHHYVVFAHDITAQKQQEQQRLDEEKLRHETFIREIHHRIKNHLQGVIGLLRNSMAEEPSVPENFNVLISKISALAGVYSISSRHLGPALPLADILNSVTTSISCSPGTLCRLDADNPGPAVWIDSDESVPIALVLNELVTNACKHRRNAAAPVTISLRMDGSQAVVRISSAGCLPPGLSFQQRTGIGMGLSLVHSLLPRDCAALSIEQCGTDVIARLTMAPPLLVLAAGE